MPYLFEDWWKRRDPSVNLEPVAGQTQSYAGFLAYLTVFPLILQIMDRPLLVVVLYAVAGAFFMPLLAGTLLVINNRKAWVGELKNSHGVNVGLVSCLLLFGTLFVLEVSNRIFS